MAIVPPGEPPRFIPSAPRPPSAEDSNPRAKNAAAEQRSAPSAVVEQETQARARLAQETEDYVTSVRDEYVRRGETEKARVEGAIENQKQKGYEAIRDLQRRQQAELNRVRRDGEVEHQRLTEHYRNALHDTSSQGEHGLAELKGRHTLEQEQLLRKSNAELEQLQTERQLRLSSLKENHEAELATLTQDYRLAHDKLRARAEEARAAAQESFKDRVEGVMARQGDALERINHDTNAKIREIRQDTAAKLAAYSSRQQDPFYRLLDLGARLSETNEAYVLTANIPEHEQKTLQVTVRGDQLVLSGNRRNEEKLQLETGRSKSTSSFQTYSETFKLNLPVEVRKIIREFDGDQVTIYVPKKGIAESPQYRAKTAAKTPERAKLERPQFPDNLPVVKHEAPLDPEAAPPEGPSPKGHGTSTLS